MMELTERIECVKCHIQFRFEFERQWARLWDGKLWRMYEYLPGMVWGPYCTGCIGPLLNSLNKEPWKGHENLPEEKAE